MCSTWCWLCQHLPVPGEGRTALGEDSQPEGIRLAGRRKGHIRGRVVAAGNHRICIRKLISTLSNVLTDI